MSRTVVNERARSLGEQTRTERLPLAPEGAPASHTHLTAPFMLVVSSPLGCFVQPVPSEARVVMGRGADCDLVVDHASVSRQHAVLRTLGALTVEDLGSTNGVRVNGRLLEPRATVAIDAGDAIELGSVLVLVQRGAPVGLIAQGLRPSAPLRVAGASEDASGPIVADAHMRRLYGLLDLVAPTPLSVLVLGETGVGKEVFADAIHRASDRARGPLVALNCAALPESVLEGELFGYEKGAFTGAVQARAGLFEAAEGGTVFLDEVGELSLATQAKLLRVLELGEVMRIGARKPVRVDFRVVAATNRDLKAMVASGSFRSDLFFRFNGITVTLPPLRDRRDDVLPLARMFLARARQALRRAPLVLTAAAERSLLASAWPGNIRELRNVIDRAAALARGTSVDIADLRESDLDVFAGASPDALPAREGSVPPPAPSGSALKEEIRSVEKGRILGALAQTHGNQKRAAEILGISRRALVNKLDVYGIAGPRKPRSE